MNEEELQEHESEELFERETIVCAKGPGTIKNR